MALKHRNERATVDIDMCFREQNHLYQCCKKVAAKHHLPDDWVNADVMHSDSFSYALFDNATLDIQDMIVLQNNLRKQGIQVDDVKKNFVRLYGSEYLLFNDARKTRFVEAQLG